MLIADVGTMSESDLAKPLFFFDMQSLFVAIFLVFCCLSLICCKRVFSSLCIGSVICDFIYKAGRKSISRESDFAKKVL
jgi:hypothetical protein